MSRYEDGPSAVEVFFSIMVVVSMFCGIIIGICAPPMHPSGGIPDRVIMGVAGAVGTAFCFSLVGLFCWSCASLFRWSCACLIEAFRGRR
jgi:hypothetical protein